MSSVESAYLELDNVQSTSLCGYYLEVYPDFGFGLKIPGYKMSYHLLINIISNFFWQHFLQDEAILGSEYKAQLHKTLLVGE